MMRLKQIGRRRRQKRAAAIEMSGSIVATRNGIVVQMKIDVRQIGKELKKVKFWRNYTLAIAVQSEDNLVTPIWSHGRN